MVLSNRQYTNLLYVPLAHALFLFRHQTRTYIWCWNQALKLSASILPDELYRQVRSMLKCLRDIDLSWLEA